MGEDLGNEMNAELEFLNGLGMWRPKNLRPRDDGTRRLRLLENYRDSMEVRERWGGIHRQKIQETVNVLIAIEEEKCRQESLEPDSLIMPQRGINL